MALAKAGGGTREASVVSYVSGVRLNRTIHDVRGFGELLMSAHGAEAVLPLGDRHNRTANRPHSAASGYGVRSFSADAYVPQRQYSLDTL